MSTDSFKSILTNHKTAIALALLASIIVAFPQVYFRIDHRDDGIYQGIELLPDSPWSPRVREVQDGHPNFGSIYYKDGKGDPYLFQPLGSMVVGYMGKALLLDINDTLLLSRLALTFIVFLLIYGFVYLLSNDKLVALSSAMVILLADSLLSFFGISQIFQGLSPDDFLQIARPVIPVTVYLLLFGFLVSFWLFYRKRLWQFGVLSAILLGLNFYNYFYSWTYLYAFGGLLVLFFLMQRKWHEVLRIGSVFLGALLVAVPYLINLVQVTRHPMYEIVAKRVGVIESHALLFVGFTVVGALVAFLLWFPREDTERYLFSLALVLIPFITMNQQLLTGKILQPAHYHWFFHKPIAVILVLVAIFYVFTKQNLVSYRKALAALIIMVSVATGVFVQAASYAVGVDDGGSIAIERQKYGPVVGWLNEHAEREAVVLANDEASHITVIYTPLNVFYHRAAFHSLAATKGRLLDVLFTFYRLRSVGEEDVREVFFAEREHISANVYGIYYRELLGSYEAIPDEEIEGIVARYKEALATPTSKWLKGVWSRYEVEYVLWDKKVDPEWQLEQYPFLEEAAVFREIAIYRFSAGK